MDRRSSLNGRLSLSTTNIYPLAESTHINGSNMPYKFPWGGKASPHKKEQLNNSHIQKTMPKVVRSPVRKIDPRIYTDIQSNGLTSRIVKYHDTSSKLNRSMSMSNIYNKPGQFPIVHLKRIEIPYRPRRNQSISMVRIAPPDKSVFQANTRSSILRTGSMVPTIGLHKTVEKDLRENRPIVPPAENDLNPTRSVLDALKEISRKRINSDDVDCSDVIKKYCKESEEDLRRSLSLPLQNIGTSAAHVSVITKRQREIPSPTDSKPSPPDTNDLKKRMCTKNNDISSSLSSSLLFNTPKRKLQDIQSRPPISARYSPSSGSLAPPQAKQQCNESNYVAYLDHETATYPRVDQIISRPSKPTADSMTNNASVVVAEKQKPAAPTISQKPKLTLFNKDYDTTTTVSPAANNNRQNSRQPDEEGIAGISFVKPNNKSPVLTGKNALIERVQSSKLSLMLSCLSGELNDSDDEIDSKKAPEKPQKIALLPVVDLTNSTTIESHRPTIATTVASIVPEIAPEPTDSLTPTSISSTSKNLPLITTTATTDISFGSKPGDQTSSPTTAPSNPPAAPNAPIESQSLNNSTFVNQSSAITPHQPTNSMITSTVAPTFNYAAPKSSAIMTGTTSANQFPSAGGFSFGQSKPANDTTAITRTTVTSSFTDPTPGAFSFGAQTAAKTVVATSSLPFNAPTSTFGAPASSVNMTKTAFSFGPTTSTPAPIMSSTTALPTSTAFSATLVPTSRPPMFGTSSFGSATSIISSAVTNPQEPPSSTFSGFSSGGFNGTHTNPPGNKSPPKFGESANVFGTNTATVNSGFGFGASLQQPKPTVATGMFSTNLSAPVATTASNAFGFGANDMNKSTNPAPSFNFSGSAVHSGSNPPPAFGASTVPTANQQVSAFSFNAPAATSKPAITAAPSLFNFGGNAAQSPQNTSIGFSFNSNGDSKPAVFGFGNTMATNNVPEAPIIKPFAATGGFAFNPSIAAATENKNIFGSTPAATTQQPTKSFSFSAVPSTGSINTEQKVASSIFGSSVNNNSNAAPPPFGTPATTPGKLFSFGGAPAKSNFTGGGATNPTTNLFGNPSAASITPLFPAAANITPSSFGSTTNTNNNSSAQMFSFGGNSASNTANNSTGSGPFSFEGAGTKSDASKPFAFSTPSGPPSAPQGIFGNTTAPKPPAFNFTGGASGDGSNNNHLSSTAQHFNQPTGGPENTARREFRHATRRLNKPK